MSDKYTRLNSGFKRIELWVTQNLFTLIRSMQKGVTESRQRNVLSTLLAKHRFRSLLVSKGLLTVFVEKKCLIVNCVLIKVLHFLSFIYLYFWKVPISPEKANRIEEWFNDYTRWKQLTIEAFHLRLQFLIQKWFHSISSKYMYTIEQCHCCQNNDWRYIVLIL